MDCCLGVIWGKSIAWNHDWLAVFGKAHWQWLHKTMNGINIGFSSAQNWMTPMLDISTTFPLDRTCPRLSLSRISPRGSPLAQDSSMEAPIKGWWLNTFFFVDTNVTFSNCDSLGMSGTSLPSASLLTKLSSSKSKMNLAPRSVAYKKPKFFLPKWFSGVILTSLPTWLPKPIHRKKENVRLLQRKIASNSLHVIGRSLVVSDNNQTPVGA